jgi:hypothetical protein
MKNEIDKNRLQDDFNATNDEGDDDNADSPVQESFLEQLEQTGMTVHFQSMIGGHKTLQVILLIQKRLISFLCWAYAEVNRFPIDAEEVNLVSWFKEVEQFHDKLISSYTIFLELNQGFRGGTIVNHLYDILLTVRWLAHYKPLCNDDGSPLQINMDAFEYIVKAANKQHRKKQRKEASMNDMENAVANRRMPKNGLKSLIQCVLDNSERMEPILSKNGFLSKEEFDNFVGLMYTSMYTMTTQGRVGGIEALRYGQVDELLLNGYILSRNFKSRSSWFYQPCIFSKLSVRLIRHYVTYIRPKLVNTSNSLTTHEPLWLDWNGQAEKGIGRHVTRYFSQHLDVHITTTAIRSLVETQAQQLFERGVINKEQRESICHINGHSLATAEMFYIERDRIQDVYNTRDFFQLIVANDPDASDSRHYDDLDFGSVNWKPHREYEYRDWGQLHPEYGQQKKRYMWTKQELTFIQEWYQDRVLKRCDTGRLMTVASLWNYITKGPGMEKALPIFHTHHILNATRLRHGYRVVCGHRPSRYG